jgi:mannonate dehydratase
MHGEESCGLDDARKATAAPEKIQPTHGNAAQNPAPDLHPTGGFAEDVLAMKWNRRTFITTSGTAAAMASLNSSSNSAEDGGKPANRPRMHLGCQRGPTDAKMLDFFKRHGVEAICGYPQISPGLDRWTSDDLRRTQDLCEKHGIALEMVALPLLSSSHIDREKQGAILLGEEPQRSRDIERIQKMIAACGDAGVPAFKYNLSLLGVLRTASTPGRGGARYSTWKLADAKGDPPLTRAGKVDANLFWERIDYLLQRIIPICNEHKVRAACHPHDPGVSPSGFQGVDRVLGTVEGLKRLMSIQESPYHGLNFCVGTVAEMLSDPGREICDVIRFFGTRKKIFNIHLRNIRGRRDDFQEVYPDEGDLNLAAVIRTLHEMEYPYMVMPDHMPGHPDDPGGLQAFAYGYGYLKGLLQALI